MRVRPFQVLLAIASALTVMACQSPHGVPKPATARTETQTASRPSQATVEPQSALFTNANSSLSRELTGVAEQVSLPTRAELGQGYSRLSQNLRGFAVRRDDSHTTRSSENAVTYDLNLIDSYKELAKSLKLDAKASYKGVGGGASASMSLFKSSKFSSRRVYVLVSMRVINGTEALADLSLTTNALTTVVPGETQEQFLTRYGDAFIVRLVRGAELFALLEFSQQKGQSLESLKADVKGGMSGFSASVSLQKKVSELTEKKNVRIHYAQTGGSTGRAPSAKDPPDSGTDKRDFDSGGVLALTPEQLLSRIREFPSEARSAEGANNAAILWGEILDYRVAENWPAASGLSSYAEVFWALEDLGSAKLLVDQLHHDAEEIVEDPFSYPAAEQEKAKRMLRYSDYVAEQMARLAESTIRYPQLAPNLVSDILPTFSAFQKHACNPDDDCTTPELKCPAARADEHSVAECLLEGEYPYLYDAPPAKIATTLDGWHWKTQAHWGHGDSAYLCNTQIPPADFELVIAQTRNVNLGKRRDYCVTNTSECNGLNEYCVQYYFVDACFINTAWHNWYKSNNALLNRPYSAAQVCQ